MSQTNSIIGSQSLDWLLFNIEPLKDNPELSEVVASYLDGNYKAVLQNSTSQTLFGKLAQTISLPRAQQNDALQNSGLESEAAAVQVLITGLAAIGAFLQANVTGPPMTFADVLPKTEAAHSFKELCLKSLDVDGTSVYQHIPYVELFCLARLVFTVFFPRIVGSEFRDAKWMRMRINAYHQRLLSGVSGGRLSESTMLQDSIDRDLAELEVEILAENSTFSTEAKVQFSLEKAQIYILQGLDIKARENVKLAKTVSGFSYALSGALGKRTKFQQNDLSQLIVFAKSGDSDASTEKLANGLSKSTISNGGTSEIVPTSLQLNDDTLLEAIEFTSDKVENSDLPTELAELKPMEQPQLKPLDQITLLTEATIKDTFLPLDKLNSEEILPYAVRVLSDKPTNWQIYTQALLVRSRIESHRSRTQERSILQLQVIVDQIIADTQEEPSSSPDGIPEIRVTQFMPHAKASESAPIAERLRYIYQLNTPTRWEIETELAYAWTGAGSFVSALEIFKRLQLWPEVALCYHSVGQEGKARQVVRRQLYFSANGAEMDEYPVDAPELITENWEGETRPAPAHAPRLWCILGDLENDPKCWMHAWEISKHRYARAQRSLGEYYIKSGDLEKAREAYMQATIVNRQNNDAWSRLGDLDLRIGNWDGAIIAFQQSIMIDETDAKTYSNLGSALLSKHAELITLQKAAAKDAIVPVPGSAAADDEDEDFTSQLQTQTQQNPKEILKQALSAYKRGASLANSNWQIWDNVLTIASRMQPPSFSDLLLALRSIIRIRAAKVGEYAVDIEVLRLLVLHVTSSERAENTYPGEKPEDNGGQYIPPRGSVARALISVVEVDIIPLVTKRWELWVLIEKVNLYRKDYEGALRCAERSWRLVTGSEEWLVEKEAWKGVVGVTDNLVSAYENYGPMEKQDGTEVEKGWRMKARSAVRGVMSKARDAWEETEEWGTLEGLLEGLKS